MTDGTPDRQTDKAQTGTETRRDIHIKQSKLLF